MNLPDLEHDFGHASLDRIQIGPRREVTLFLQLLLWDGQTGYWNEEKSVRFGNIVNFAEVEAFFTDNTHFQLANLRYSTEHHSKPQSLWFDITMENADGHITIHCANFTVSD